MAVDYPRRVAEIRPSQLLWSSGVGAIVDLPHFSVVVRGLGSWTENWSVPVPEARLLRAVQRVMGPQVSLLRAAPLPENPSDWIDPFSEDARIGVPVEPFPGWLRCPMCQLLARADSGLFELKTDPFRLDRNKFVHANCTRGRQPAAVPARFSVACRNGHLDDFPWHWFIHRGPSNCTGSLEFFEVGASLETSNLWVKCSGCDVSARSMVEAVGASAEKALPRCRGRHPHLGRFEECDEPLRMIMLGASNSWFPVTMSVLSVPIERDRLRQLVDDNWALLGGITERSLVPVVVGPLKVAGQLVGIEDFDDDTIWRAIEEKRSGVADEADGSPDLKGPEWEVFTDPNPPQDYPDFLTRSVSAPDAFSAQLADVVLAERLREVNALIGFTRVEPPDQGIGGNEPPPRAPLTNASPNWVPATEVRGEGIFLRFAEEPLRTWMKTDAVTQRAKNLLAGHRAWRAARKLEPPEEGFPGPLFIMLHTIAHVLIRELALECGYAEASIRERIYASLPDEEPTMAGILLYTSAPDSDGTLGGLVSLGEPENLGRLILRGLERTALCSSDPLCSEHDPGADRSLHGAACHACTFVSETSCEFGNRYLDRALVVTTLGHEDAAFFDEYRP